MNILVTSPNPVKCAEVLDDSRVSKMTLETAQLLSTALRLNGVDSPSLYRLTHKHHPCVKWVSQTRGNFMWLYEHGLALAAEYTNRFGKIHKSEAVIRYAANHSSALPEGSLSPFVNCACRQSLGVDYRHMSDVHLAYQLYLSDRWDLDKNPRWYKISK